MKNILLLLIISAPMFTWAQMHRLACANPSASLNAGSKSPNRDRFTVETQKIEKFMMELDKEENSNFKKAVNFFFKSDPDFNKYLNFVTYNISNNEIEQGYEVIDSEEVYFSQYLKKHKDLIAYHKASGEEHIPYESFVPAMETSVRVVEYLLPRLPKAYFNNRVVTRKVLLYFEYIDAVEQIKERSSFVDCGLSDLEIYAVYAHTAGHSFTSNQNASNHKLLAPMVEALNSALQKLAPFNGRVFLKTRLNENLRKEHQVGNTVTYPGFISASIKEPVIEIEPVIITSSKSGKYIAPLSAYPFEEDVLFTNGSKFLVEKKNGRHYELIEN